jgi:predicted outer membrane lipoprotein
LPNHRVIVATGFRVAGWLLGVPSLLAFLALTASVFELHQMAATGRASYLDIKTYGLVGLLANGAAGLDNFVQFLAGVGAWVAAALAILAFVAALGSVLVYVIGRGVGRRATWARILGGLVSLGVLLFTVGVWSLVGRDAAPVACAVCGVSLYSLWVLGWRFA